MNEKLEKIKGMQAAYRKNAVICSDLLKEIVAALNESEGIVTPDVNTLYKKREKVVKELGKITQKINKAKEEVFK